MQKFNIRLNVAGKSYALGIEREKEEIFRRAEKEVNRLTAAVESQYMADREDYLAVVALQLAVKVVELEASRSLGRDIDELDALNRRLDEHLNRLREPCGTVFACNNAGTRGTRALHDTDRFFT